MSAADPTVLREDLTLLMRPEFAVSPMNELSHGLTRLQIGALAAAGIFLLLLLWMGLRRRPRLCSQHAARAAHLRALEELTLWRELNDEDRYRDAVAAISGTLRRYVSARYGFEAPCLTSEEFWEVQRASARIPSPLAPFWEDFLAIGDMIKYAGQRPDSHEFRRLYGSSVQFVESSHAQRRVAFES